MGLASIAASLTLACLVVAAFLALTLSYAEYGRWELALKERERILEDKIRSSISIVGFNCTNITADTHNATAYLKNTGLTSMHADCVDYIIDGVWASKPNVEAVPLPGRFDQMVWNPSETLAISAYRDLDPGEHNATLISCQGDRVEARFNASKCGDGVCHGGEYCLADNSSCPDNVCREPTCLGGCGQITISNAPDVGQCDDTFSDGLCLSAPCECGPGGACCGVEDAPCESAANCCPGYACTDSICQ